MATTTINEYEKCVYITIRSRWHVLFYILKFHSFSLSTGTLNTDKKNTLVIFVAYINSVKWDKQTHSQSLLFSFSYYRFSIVLLMLLRVLLLLLLLLFWRHGVEWMYACSKYITFLGFVGFSYCFFFCLKWLNKGISLTIKPCIVQS